MADDEENTDSASDEDAEAVSFTPTSSFTPEVKTSLEPLVDWTHGSVILGRGRRTHDKLGLSGTVQIGAVCEKQTEKRSLFGYKVRVDIEFPHIMFLCGKRGSGKSYSLGIFAEELAKLRTGLGVVIIDPIGTFWSLKNSNKTPSEISALTQWGLEPRGLKNVLVYTPIGFYNEYRGIVDKPFSISPVDLTAEDWCLVFDVERFKTQGLLIGDAIEKVKKGYTAKFENQVVEVPPKAERFSIGDIIQCIEHDITITSKEGGFAQTTRRSMIARYNAASRWGLFSTDGTPVSDLSVPNVVTVLDVSHPKIGDARRSLIVGIIARKILEARLATTRMEDATAMGMETTPIQTIPITWLLIDEAHLMLPHSGKTAASDALIEYAKLGRKPGCAMILATQRPAATNDDILSQVDLLIGHTLALEDDITAFRKRVPAMLPPQLGSSNFIRSIPVGIALVADQKTQKRTMLVQLRPRLTHHAGRVAPTASVKEPGIEFEKAAAEAASSAEAWVAAASVKDTESALLEPLKPTVSLSDLISPAAPAAEAPAAVKSVKKKGGVPPAEAPEVKRTGEERAASAPEPKTRTAPAAADSPGLFESEGVEYTPENLELTAPSLVLIRTKNSEATFELYRAVADRYKAPALSISRTHPDKLTRYFSNESAGVESFWLSNSAGENNIGPTNLEKLAHQFNRHIKTGNETESGQGGESKTSPAAPGAAGKPSLAILEGLEYLVSNNDFNKVLRFIEALHEKVLLNKAVGLLPVNPSALDARELQLLEREMDMCLTYTPPKPAVDEPPEEPTEKPVGISGGEPAMFRDAEPESGSGAEAQKAFLRSLENANKKKLVSICRKLEIDAVGSRDELYNRVLDYIKTHPVSIKRKDKRGREGESERGREGERERGREGERERGREGESERGREGESERGREGERERVREGELDKQYNEIDKQRKKLHVEREKLLRDKLKHEHELHMSKLKSEREKLTAIKTELTAKEKELGKREKEFDKRLSELEKRQAKVSKKKLPVADDDGDAEFDDGLELDVGDPSWEVVEGPTAVIPKLEQDVLMELIDKKLGKSLLGKKKEEVSSIKPVYLPLLKTSIKVPGGRIRKKEYSHDLLWDTISGEIIIDYKNGLKRTQGLDAFYNLTQPMMKLLLELSSMRGQSQIELMKDTGIAKAQATRSLNKLVDMGLISRKLDSSGGKSDQYKRAYKLKIPGHPERSKFEFAEAVPRKLRETKLTPKYGLKEVKKIMEGVVPGARVVRSDTVYYPYFLVKIKGEGRKYRSVFIDAVTGTEDTTLGKLF